MDKLQIDVFPDGEHLLLFLLVGLEAQREQENGARSKQRRLYPYPATLVVAWNALGYYGMTTQMIAVPRTLTGLRQRCTLPLSQWFPTTLIPSDFPPNAPLLYAGSIIDLSHAAEEFLNDRIFSDIDFANIKLQDAQQLSRFLENQRFVEILKRLRGKQWSPALQAEYVKLRRFLIENPYTTRAKISHAFATTSALSPLDVGKLYEACYPHETYYHCGRCGLLRTVTKNRLVGAKPDVCSDHAFDAPHIRHVAWEEGLCRLSPSIHARVALHGIAEVEIFNQLHSLQQKRPKRILMVEEWPDIDSFDLRIVFSDGTAWAVDIKDFALPERLSGELTEIKGRGDHARFDQAFYVVPKRRLAKNLNYLNDARAGADKLPPTYRLCDDETFVTMVLAYRPKKGAKA